MQPALSHADLQALLIAESDTGSGKTEAALMHFLALFSAGKVDGLYFALPTRVAARELYGRVSATLGAAARAEYLHPSDSRPQPEAFDQAVALPYPALSAPDAPMRHLPDPLCRSKSVRLEPLPLLKTPEDLIHRLREAVRSGQRILVILNTVGRAIALTQLVDTDPELAAALFTVNDVRAPHHGRFARANREQMDRTVSDRMGRNSPDGAMLLIGTRTLEQNLDIDADWLLTDLCPIDVLLQRIGRLHRHDRGPRPMPGCSVMLPEEVDFSVFLSPKGEVRRGNLAGLGVLRFYATLRPNRRTEP